MPLHNLRAYKGDGTRQKKSLPSTLYALACTQALANVLTQVLSGLKGAGVRVQKPVGNFIRAVLLMPLYVPLFAPKAYSSATASHVYTIVLKVRASRPQGECRTALEGH